MTAYQRRQQRAREFVSSVRANTVCVDCGAQPVEWHNPDHEARHQDRIGPMMGRGCSPDALRIEMARSTPLCRRCHMKRDGRLAILAAFRTATRPPKPCIECRQLYKPLRRGMCSRCYQRQWKKTAES